MRDRLIELIRDCCKFEYCLGKTDLNICKNQCKATATLADHLLANGVITLPAKMGDELYMPWEWNGQKGIAYLTVTVLRCISGFGWSFGTDFDTDDEDYYEAYNCGSFKLKDFGKTVFLTREEAEKALAERSNEMPKYIDREALVSIFNAKADMAIGTPKEVFHKAAKMVELLPAADVVEVVRCGKCKNNYGIANSCEFNPQDIVCCYWDSDGFDENDFCSYGERSTENAE